MTAIVGAGRGVVTPQGVVLDLETAGIGHRGAARLLDTVVLIGVVIVLTLLLELLGGVIGGTAVFVMQLVLGFLIVFGYPVIAETYFRGRTIGKYVIGLRVVTLEGGPVGFREAFIRSLFQLIDLSLIHI